VFVYDQACRELVLAAKNHGRRDLLRPFGRALADQLATRLDPEAPWEVTWVPCSATGRHARGFDQGRILARVVAAHLGLEFSPLLRRVDAVAQTGRSREQRLVGPRFRARRPATGFVVLVDDVTTTGATLRSAAAALESAGARQVVPAAIASVP
jgi:predicted amidophosphoribosyltransferase